MKMLIIAIILISFPGLSHSLSFVYDGFECEGSQSPSSTPRQSRLEVLEDFGNGTYRILITGGLPLFSNSTGPCVGNAFGVETNDKSDGKPIKKNDVQAIANLSGTNLVITLSTLEAFGEGSILGGVMVMSSMVMPHTYTWIFEFIPETTTLKLVRNIETIGTVMFVGTVSPEPGEVIETMMMNSPTTATAPSLIEYRVE